MNKAHLYMPCFSDLSFKLFHYIITKYSISEPSKEFIHLGTFFRVLSELGMNQTIEDLQIIKNLLSSLLSWEIVEISSISSMHLCNEDKISSTNSVYTFRIINSVESICDPEDMFNKSITIKFNERALNILYNEYHELKR